MSKAGRPNTFLTKEEVKELIERQITMECGVPIATGEGFLEYLVALFIREFFYTDKEYSEDWLDEEGWNEANERYKFLESKTDQDVIKWENNLKETDYDLYYILEEEIEERLKLAHLYGDIPALLGEYFEEKGLNNNLSDDKIIKAFANGVPFDWIIEKIQIHPTRLLLSTKTTQEHIGKINNFMQDILNIDAAILPISFDLNGVMFGRLNNTGKFAFLFNELEKAGFIRKDWQKCISLGYAIKSQKIDLILPKDISKALSKANEEQYDIDKIDEYRQIIKFVEDLQEF